ncbi:MAG: ribonuclease J [Lachnospiraceae bacterium]|nr:ribonuclease J [Lachnospiraceae bacterium]
MNMTVFEYGDSMIIVDCGLAFPSEEMPGIDLVIPDITYVKQNEKRLKGIFITHGHEDHIGALPYVLTQLSVPVTVYATLLTVGIVEKKFEEHPVGPNVEMKVVCYGDTIKAGDFSVEFIRTNHSISDSAALAIFSPAGVIVHTGDFKIDYTPVFGDTADLQRFAELGSQGVLAMLCDSTNAVRPGFTSSERTVGRTLDALFSENRDHRIIVATFASNVDRVQQIINSAHRYGRRVAVEGRSMVNIIGTAIELGRISIPEGVLVDLDALKNYPENQTVIITTGSQGESMAALSRMAASSHKKVTILPGDVVIISATPIPGNEKAVYKVINELSRKGAKVIFQDTHVSGHACQEEIKLMYSLVRPKFALPVHGEYRHLMAQAAIVEALGIPKENIPIMSCGDVLELTQESAKIVNKVTHGAVLVDGLGVGDVGNIVLRERQNLALDGIIVVVMTLEKETNALLAGPDMISRGFVYIRDSENYLDEIQEVLDDAVYECMEQKKMDWSHLKNTIRDRMSDYIWKTMRRSPMILPIIMEVE